MKLHGYVRNLGNVVEILLEGNEKEINEFVNNLKENKPPISEIKSIVIEWQDNPGSEFKDFKILESSKNYSGWQLFLLT